MNLDHPDFCEFDDKPVSVPVDISIWTRLAFLDEDLRSRRSKVIRVEFAGETAKQVLVRRSSHDERHLRNSTAR